MAKQRDRRRAIQDAVATVGPRNWRSSLFWAAVWVGIGILASATINPLFDRSVHWDWMAGVAPVGFAALALALRRRWV